MSLHLQIKSDLKEAMVSRDQFRVSVLRMLVSSINNAIKSKFGSTGGDLNDEEIESILRKEAKKRAEAVKMFTAGGRDDLAENEKTELDIISAYLPPSATSAEIESIVKEIIASGDNDFGSVMKKSMERLGSSANGQEVSKIVKAVISQG